MYKYLKVQHRTFARGISQHPFDSEIDNSYVISKKLSFNMLTRKSNGSQVPLFEYYKGIQATYKIKNIILYTSLHFCRIEGVIRAETVNQATLTDDMYSRTLIAEYEGRPAGLCALKFHNDK